MAVGADILARRMAAFAEACRKHGLKITHQRMELFREVAGTEEHPDAETVLRRMRARVPTVARDTVYRTLHTLEKAGLVSTVGATRDPARFDANADRHDHFVCTECGLIRDFTDEGMDRYAVPERVRSWGRVVSVRLEIRGVCETCLGRGGRGGN